LHLAVVHFPAANMLTEFVVLSTRHLTLSDGCVSVYKERLMQL